MTACWRGGSLRFKNERTKGTLIVTRSRRALASRTAALEGGGFNGFMAFTLSPPL
jgi:hypothetical protein